MTKEITPPPSHFSESELLRAFDTAQANNESGTRAKSARRNRSEALVDLAMMESH